MGDKMKNKFDKYWGDPSKMNKLIFLANILDPRDKFEYIEYAFCEMYDDVNGKKLFNDVREDLKELFIEYKNLYYPENKTLSESSHSHATDSEGSIKNPISVLKTRFKKQKMESGSSGFKRSELEVYLNEAILEDKIDFDILKWWKLNSERFLVLSKMPQDILVISISTVTSEFTFSMGGRVLDAFRSSLTPNVVDRH